MTYRENYRSYNYINTINIYRCAAFVFCFMVSLHEVSAQTGGVVTMGEPEGTTPPSFERGGALGGETCEPLRETIAAASEFAAASIKNIQEYKKRFAMLIAEIEKEAVDSKQSQMSSKLESLKLLHKQLNELNKEEGELKKQENALVLKWNELKTLCKK
jgi:hypothetical protein